MMRIWKNRFGKTFFILFACLFLSGCDPSGLLNGCVDHDHTTKILTSNFKLFYYVADKIERTVNNTVTDFLNKFTTAPGYRNILALALVLYFTFWGVAVTGGMVSLNGYDVVMRVVKITAVWGLATNPQLIHDYVQAFFDGAKHDIMGYFFQILADGMGNSFPGCSDQMTDFTNAFKLIDCVFMDLFSGYMSAFALALIFTGPAGWLGGFMIFCMIVFFFLAMFEVLKVYLFSIVGLAVVYMVSPIFFGFLLFSQTKTLFDGWLKTAVSLTLQPIFMSAYLILLTKPIFWMLSQLFSFTVCWRPFISTPPIPWWRIVPLDGKEKWGWFDPLPIDFVTMILLVYFTWLFWKFNERISYIANIIAGTNRNDLSTLGGNVARAAVDVATGASVGAARGALQGAVKGGVKGAAFGAAKGGLAGGGRALQKHTLDSGGWIP